VEPLAHEMLPLSPIVTLHSASAVQLMLHECPHVPEHVLPALQASEQLSPPQPEFVMSHDVFGAHMHEAPLHCGGSVEPPQATRD